MLQFVNFLRTLTQRAGKYKNAQLENQNWCRNTQNNDTENSDNKQDDTRLKSTQNNSKILCWVLPFLRYAECHNADFLYAEWHYDERQYAACLYDDVHYAEYYNVDCRYADCRYAECHYTESRDTRLFPE